jgi:ubiquinone/menaquinone biosynthesis C-methylase UbiE
MSSKNIDIQHTIVTDDYTVEIPEDFFQQTEEYVIVKFDDNTKKRVQLHDYTAMYSLPGLYETVIYDVLKCNSHCVLTENIKCLVGKKDFRVIELGAGNGVFAEELKNNIHVDYLMGIDINPAAKKAEMRDRPELYVDYLISDIALLKKSTIKTIREKRFDLLVIPSALALAHIPVKSLSKIIDMLPENAYFVFNLKKKIVPDFFIKCPESDRFLFKAAEINGQVKNIHHEEYIHRYNFSGEPYYYVCFIYKKI